MTITEQLAFAEIERVKTYSKLRKTWHFGIGAISHNIIEKTINVISVLSVIKDFESIATYPEADGTISLVIEYNGEEYVSIDIDNKELFYWSHEECIGYNVTSLHSDKSTLYELANYIKEMK